MRELGVSNVPVVITRSKLFVGWSSRLKQELTKGFN